jgi:hypothetical protein
MKVMAAILTAGTLGAGLGLAGCAAGSAAPAASSSSSGTSPPAASSPTASSPAAASPAASSPAPTATKTVIKTVQAAPTTPAAAPAAPSSAARSSAAAAPAQAPPGGPNVTDPWAVVSAYYGDIESGNFAQAYALIGSGAATGQSYGEFAAGFTCTGGQDLSQNWESGDQVNFDLTATDSCTGDTDYYTGTDTVENGTIVSAQITQNG